MLKGDLESDFRAGTLGYPKGKGIFIAGGPEEAHKAGAAAPSVSSPSWKMFEF